MAAETYFDRAWQSFHIQEEQMYKAKGDAYALPDDPLVNYRRASEVILLMKDRLSEFRQRS